MVDDVHFEPVSLLIPWKHAKQKELKSSLLQLYFYTESLGKNDNVQESNIFIQQEKD